MMVDKKVSIYKQMAHKLGLWAIFLESIKSDIVKTACVLIVKIFCLHEQKRAISVIIAVPS